MGPRICAPLIVGPALLLIVLTGVTVDPPWSESEWGPSYFPDVPLVTQDGATVRFYTDLLKGKTVAVNVMYTHCRDECPLETARLVQLQKLLGNRMGTEIFFYSISIDPGRDTPAVLKAYAERFGVGPGWLFLTGRETDIHLVQKKLGLFSVTDSADRDGHKPTLMIGNEPTGQWMRNSAVDNPRFLAAKIGTLLKQWQMGTAGQSYRTAPPIRAMAAGAYLFQTRCTACHTIGQGDRVGPDLLGVTSRRDRAWLARYLAAPDALVAERDPTALELVARYGNVPMPNLKLGEADVVALIDYLAAKSSALEAREAR
jgi:protein SCO1